MRMLYEAGADVPEVFGRSNGAILMEYLGDEAPQRRCSVG